MSDAFSDYTRSEPTWDYFFVFIPLKDFFLCDTFKGASLLTWWVKNLPVNTGHVKDVGLIPGWGRSPQGGNGSLLQYSCLSNPMHRGAWWATVQRISESDPNEHAWMCAYYTTYFFKSVLNLLQYCFYCSFFFFGQGGMWDPSSLIWPGLNSWSSREIPGSLDLS